MGKKQLRTPRKDAHFSKAEGISDLKAKPKQTTGVPEGGQKGLPKQRQPTSQITGQTSMVGRKGCLS